MTQTTNRPTRAWKFFFNHAGWATPPGRTACAKELAEAEAWAQREGVKAQWVPDDMPWDGEGPPPEEVMGCILELDGETVSLWGIGDPAENYRRVVEAELASQLRHTMYEKVAVATPQL